MEFETGTTIRLWTDYQCDINDIHEYEWIGRWTAKSLIITAAENSNLPLAMQEERYIIPRAEAERKINETGSIGHRRRCFDVVPWALRSPNLAEHIRNMQVAEARQQERYEALSQERLALIERYIRKCGLEHSASFAPYVLTVNDLIEQQGEEVFRGRLGERRTLESPWEPAW